MPGVACPVPVLKNKDFIEAYPDVSEFMVVVDNAASCQNVVRFVTSRGYSTSTKQKGADIEIKAVKSKDTGAETAEHVVSSQKTLIC